MTPHDQHHQHDSGEHDHSRLADLLDLDDEVFGSYLDAATDWVAELTRDAPRRIADIGAGTGAGTAAIARRFPESEIIAIDTSASMLERVQARARADGFADRLRTVEADLDIRWPELGTIDLAWASSSAHELADPDRLFREVLGALSAGGLLVVVEMDAQPSFLPEHVGRGLESRLQDLMTQAGWNAHPDWTPRLEQAGFEIAGRGRFASEADTAAPSTLRYARAFLGRLPTAFAEQLTADDRSTLTHLLADGDLETLLARPGSTARTVRTAWAAKRPD